MQHLRADDPAAADPARRRLLQTSSFPRLPSLPSLHTKKTVSLPAPPLDHPTDSIHILGVPLPPPGADLYRWAILYENQRGITLFSTPFYSPLSLLPLDPQPFTIPNAHSSRQRLPNLSLDNYPLPDGTWHWVSTAWMIDMRSSLGEVQHDGFEYNWHFRHNHWHAKIGKISAGAWVRRRRWVRLMMRPATHAHPHEHTTPPSPVPPPSKLPPPLRHHLRHRWDGSEQDWQHAQRLLKHLGRDGRKLELWRMWLEPYAHTHTSDTKAKGKQSTATQQALENRLSDVVPQGNPPPLLHLATILRNHGEAILRSFVYPDSRAQFVHLVSLAGLLEELEHCLGRTFSAADVDFWSYADGLDELVDRD